MTLVWWTLLPVEEHSYPVTRARIDQLFEALEGLRCHVTVVHGVDEVARRWNKDKKNKVKMDEEDRTTFPALVSREPAPAKAPKDIWSNDGAWRITFFNDGSVPGLAELRSCICSVQGTLGGRVEHYLGWNKMDYRNFGTNHHSSTPSIIDLRLEP